MGGEDDSFLGLEVASSSVLLLSEERMATLRQKTQEAAMDWVDVLLWHEARGVLWDRVVADAVNHCIQHGIGLLVIDTWDKWSGLRGDDESRAGHVLTALEPVLEAAGRNLAVMIVAHQRKAPGHGGDAVRGSNALAGTVDVIVEVDRPDGAAGVPTVRNLSTHSRFVETPEKLRVELFEGSYRALEQGASTMRVEHARRSVLAQVQGSPGMDSRGIAEALQLPGASVRKRLEELRDDGLIHSSGAGRKNSPFRWFPALVSAGRESSSGRNQTHLEVA